MKKLVVSSGNPGKIREIRELLSEYDLEVVSKKDFDIDLEVLEDGETLSENSYKKARELKDRIDHMVMADDSGLFVEALDFRPGLYSARYAGIDASDEENNKKLLEEMKDIPANERRAYFKTVITLILEDDRAVEVQGICRGHIAFEERGDKGFGYDPLFIPEGYKESFGELGDSIKSKISHRAKALRALKEVIEKEISD